MLFPATTCQASCTSLQQQYCSSDTDCPAGLTCNAPAGFGGAGGAGGFGAGLFMLPKVCGTPPPDAGTTTPVPDAGGSPDTGSDALTE
jgi:hypothetical protein